MVYEPGILSLCRSRQMVETKWGGKGFGLHVKRPWNLERCWNVDADSLHPRCLYQMIESLSRQDHGGPIRVDRRRLTDIPFQLHFHMLLTMAGFLPRLSRASTKKQH